MRLPGPSPFALALLGLVSCAPAQAQETDRPAADLPPPAQRPSTTGLTVEDAIRLAMSRDERVRQARYEADAAEARRGRARAFFFPEFDVTGTYTRRPRQIVRAIGGRDVVVQRYNALSGTAVMNVPILWLGGIPLYRQALLEQEAAALTATEQRRLVGFETADAFVMVLSAQEIALAAERRLAFAQERLRDAAARAEAGLVSSNDVTRGELEVANAEREVSLAHGQLQLAKTELGHLLVASVETPLATPESLLAAAADQTLAPLDVQVARGRGRRLDLEAGAKRVLAAEEAAKEPALRLVPRLGGQLLGRYTNEPGLAGRTFDWQGSATLTWPLWDGGVRSAEARDRQAQASAERLGQAARTRDVALDVQRARLALENARATQEAARRARERAARHAQETAELYRQGLVRALEVADANLQQFEAEVTAARDRYALAVAFFDLKVALGEWPPGVDS
ncbi:MAG: TolC family protein [Myxococcales bacterium]|nr:TolC family protein [Myxococcales bacterium]